MRGHARCAAPGRRPLDCARCGAPSHVASRSPRPRAARRRRARRIGARCCRSPTPSAASRRAPSTPPATASAAARMSVVRRARRPRRARGAQRHRRLRAQHGRRPLMELADGGQGAAPRLRALGELRHERRLARRALHRPRARASRTAARPAISRRPRPRSSCPASDRVVNVPLNLLFQRLVTGRDARRSPSRSCSAASARASFDAHARSATPRPRRPAASSRCATSSTSARCSRRSPRPSCRRCRSGSTATSRAPGSAHRMPLFSKGPTVLVVRSGISPERLAPRRRRGRRSRNARAPPASRAGGARREIPPSSYSPTGKPGSTIAEAGLNFRVRNGNGCGPCSMDGGKNLGLAQPNGFPGPPRTEWLSLGLRPRFGALALRLRVGCGQASRAISTGQLHASLRFHLRPIDVLVSDGPSGDRSPREISSWGGLPT